MRPEELMYPVLVMIALTFFMAIWMLVLRIGAVKAGALPVTYFRLNRGAKEPEAMARVSQHFHNLLEMPPLFYIAMVAVIALQQADGIHLALAWAYVGFRLLHAAIHTTYNHVLHRMLAFLFSCVCLGAIWARLGSQLLGAA